jgi:hypothetical protein
MKIDERIEGMISNHSEHTRLVARAELGLFFWWRCKATISVGCKLQIIPYHKACESMRYTVQKELNAYAHTRHLKNFCNRLYFSILSEQSFTLSKAF